MPYVVRIYLVLLTYESRDVGGSSMSNAVIQVLEQWQSAFWFPATYCTRLHSEHNEDIELNH